MGGRMSAFRSDLDVSSWRTADVGYAGGENFRYGWKADVAPDGHHVQHRSL
jgi:hypothetical protein